MSERDWELYRLAVVECMPDSLYKIAVIEGIRHKLAVLDQEKTNQEPAGAVARVT
jgi:hypothetical protein